MLVIQPETLVKLSLPLDRSQLLLVVRSELFVEIKQPRGSPESLQIVKKINRVSDFVPPHPRHPLFALLDVIVVI